MTVTIRSDDPSGWTKVPHTLARDPRLTNGARGLALQMLSHADGYRSDQEFLAQHTADSRNEVRRQLAELRQRGYLVRERVRGDDGKLTTRSVLYDVPQQTELPIDESPSGRTSVSRSDQGRFTKAEPQPQADTRPDGVTRQDTKKPQVTPTGRPPARRSDQAEQGITAGGTDWPTPGLQSEDQGEEQKKISQSARVREVRAALEGAGWQGLTDFVIRHVIAEGMRRAATTGRPLQVPIERYLTSWDRPDLVEAIGQAYAAEDARDRSADPAEDLTAVRPPARGAQHGSEARTVAEAIAAATPDPQPATARPEPAQGCPLPENVTPMGTRRPDCPHGNQGGAYPRPGDGLPSCGPCRAHTLACRRAPGACPTCRGIADARFAERVSATA